LYQNDESRERIPRISNYYRNYLKFFCNPVFREFTFNNLIQVYGDNKAEFYYKNNYGERKINKEKTNKSISLDNTIKKDIISKNIFSDTIKQIINRNSLTQSQINNEAISSFNNNIYDETKTIRKSYFNSNSINHDVSTFSFKSNFKTKRDDSLIYDLINNLGKNTIDGSFNQRIINKVQKNKRIYDISITDMTKAEENAIIISSSRNKNKQISTINQIVRSPITAARHAHQSIQSPHTSERPTVFVFALSRVSSFFLVSPKRGFYHQCLITDTSGGVKW
jgi:hypothetical protein